MHSNALRPRHEDRPGDASGNILIRRICHDDVGKVTVQSCGTAHQPFIACCQDNLTLKATAIMSSQGEFSAQRLSFGVTPAE